MPNAVELSVQRGVSGCVYVCFQTFRGGPLFHRYCLNLAAVIGVAYHDKPVAFAGSRQKYSRKIRVELSLVYDHGVNQMSFGAQAGRCDCFILYVRSD
jgi:hypothetical protein